MMVWQVRAAVIALPPLHHADAGQLGRFRYLASPTSLLNGATETALATNCEFATQRLGVGQSSNCSEEL